MLQWEKYFQNPNLLNAYRMVSLDVRQKDLVCKLIRLSNGMRVLDVGCGTGAFTYYLADNTTCCEYIGLDISEIFIENARLHPYDCNKNSIKFIVGDALALPFPDNYFDIVTSYTFLTNVHNGFAALKEMFRVLKVGGYLSSVTAQSFSSYTEYEGNYPTSYMFKYEYKMLRSEIEEAYQKIQPISEYTHFGTNPQKIPLLFQNVGITDISIHPIGWAFSISDRSLSEDYKIRYINYDSDGQLDKLDEYSKLEDFRILICEKKIARFRELIEIRRNKLIDDIQNNDYWEWTGGSQLLVCGKKNEPLESKTLSSMSSQC